MSDTENPREAVLRRIREAREKSGAFEEKAREREELRELERKAQFEENKTRDLPHIQAAEDEHSVIRVVNTPLGAIALKRPHHLAFQRFMRKASSNKGMGEMDVWRLVKPCIAYPDVASVERITEEYPGVTIRMGNVVVELGNGEVEGVEGK
jgi:hypothetical protein